MILIINNDELLAYLPNSIRPVQGESPLFDKIESFIAIAEQWVVDYITGDILEEILDADIAPLITQLRTLVACDALNRALPSLDLILTPNGFGVVSNNTVSPASKQRVDRLIGAVREQRDAAIEGALSLLHHVEPWLSTPQAEFFGTTMFPNIDLTTLCGVTTDRWNSYIQLRARCMSIELSLEEEYFSPELMLALRMELLRCGCWRERLRVANAIRSQIVDVLQDKPINGTRMRDVVNYIRHNPELFPEWHRSKTAQLFSPPRYINNKSDKAYWF